MKRFFLPVLLAVVSLTAPGAKAQTSPSSIVISPQNSQISPGQKQQFSAAGGNTIPLQGAIAISLGEGSSPCALLSDGTVKCWGYNLSGELGNGTTTNSTTPVAVSGLRRATAVAAGAGYACALLSGGTVECWGENNYGQLGNGTTTNSTTPVVVSGLSGATAISAGGNGACALLSDGTVDCWGYGGDGELGNGTTTNSSTPVAVSGLSGATAITVGDSHNCAVLQGGTVECWGYNAFGELGNGSTTNSSMPVAVSGLSGATAVAAGSYANTCALLSDGTMECWGYGGEGGLGNGTSTYYSTTPVAVTGLSGATEITAGGADACAVLATGTAQCWGWNINGELGNGTSNNSSNVPVAVTGLAGAVAISGGYRTTCALLSDGTVQCWGWNYTGQLGNGTMTDSSVPVQVVGSVLPIYGASGIANGLGDTCELNSDGSVDCWGDNQYGELGNGTTTTSWTPVAVSGVTGATAIGTGDYHSCALLSGGTVDCWGDNRYGQLGNGTTVNSTTPVAVGGLSGVRAIAVGAWHTCALLSDGTVDCWGLNQWGEFGNGSTTNSSTPVAASGLSGVTGIAAGGLHTCALLSNGTVECWGDNAYGQIGNGTTGNGSIYVYSSAPAAVSGLTGAVEISAGDANTCALLSDGTVECWGYNAYGQLGNGTTTSSGTPVAVTGLSGATAVTAGDDTCVVLSDGGAECWGYNFDGQLGNGTTTNSSTPVAVSGLSGVTAIGDGFLSTCATLSDGTSKCWGDNEYGEMGNGTKTLTPITTPVATQLNFPRPTWSSSDSTIASMDPASGLATGLSSGTVNITVSYSSLSAQTTLTVSGGAPTITSANSASFTVGTAGSFTVTTTGNPTPAITESGALPGGVTFTDNGDGTATIAGTPAAGGTFPISIIASNGFSPDATQTFTLTVKQAPAFTSASSAAFVVGAPGSFTVATTGYPTPTLSESGTLPSGVTFAAATGVLSGTPAAGTGGTYTITFTASNGIGSNAMQTFMVTIDQAPAITSASSATFFQGETNSFTITATGFPAPALIESGALPSGVTFTDNGNGTATLAGTPPPGPAATYSIIVTASNGTGSNATQSFTLAIEPPPPPGSGPKPPPPPPPPSSPTL